MALVCCLTLAAPTGCAQSAAVPRKLVLEPAAKMPSLPPAIFDETLAIGGDDIKARNDITRMTVTVQVDGRGPYRFLVDSGADSSVIGRRIARSLQLPSGTSVLLNGMTDSSRVDRVIVATLQLGQSVVTDLQLPVLDELDLGGDGMVGIDALVEQRLMMDFEKHVIRVEDARLPQPHLDGEIVVTARRQRGQLILTQVSINGEPVDAVVDTGSEITIGNLALRDRLLRRHSRNLASIPVTGVTGVTVDVQMAQVAELRLGPVTLQNVPVAFAKVPPFAVFGLSDHPAMLLGTDLLGTFRRVSLDFRARKVRFQLRRCDPTGVVISTASSGLASRLFSNDGAGACRR